MFVTLTCTRATNGDLTISVGQQGGETVVTPVGALDAASCPTLRDLVAQLASEGQRVALDLSLVESIDPPGVGVLLGAVRQCDEAGIPLTLRAVSHAAWPALHAAGLTRLLAEPTA